MYSHWLEVNSQRFTADLLRGFCDVTRILTEQFIRFERAANLSFPVLKDLLGDMMNKGPLWRLKDLSHHLLRDAAGNTAASCLLDWAIGYIFHETIKLMEDAHQHQYYTPRLQGIIGAQALPHEQTALAHDFLAVTKQTHAGTGRTVNHTSRLLSHARVFFRLHLAGHGGNLYLARFLHDNEPEVREVFQEEFSPLLKAIYGQNPHHMHMEAALALLEGGHTERAKTAAQKAVAMAPHCGNAREVLDTVNTETARWATIAE